MVGLVLVAAFTMAGFWQLGKFRSPAPGAEPGAVSEAASDPQNLAYALQWWVFAGATVYFGIRALRMEAQDRLPPPALPMEQDPLPPPAMPPGQPPEESDAARP